MSCHVLSRPTSGSTLTLWLCLLAFPFLGVGQEVKRHDIVPTELNTLTSADALVQGGIKAGSDGPGKSYLVSVLAQSGRLYFLGYPCHRSG